MPVTSTPIHACPACRHAINRAGTVRPGDTHAPRPGDYTVCAYCLAVLRFTTAGLECVSDAERHALPAQLRAALEGAITFALGMGLGPRGTH